MALSFIRKVVIVTGSSNGIGRETARLFAEQGAKVTITGRNAESLKKTKDELLASGASAATICEVLGDLTEEETAKKIVEETVAKFGQIDVLVNNAGGVSMDPSVTPLEMPIEHYDYTMNLNTRSVILLVKHAVPHLEKTKGAIVNVSSVAGFPFTSEMPYYAMSKAALDQLTVQLAGNLIAKGIRVNSVNPGIVATDILHKLGVPESMAANVFEEMGKDTNKTPLGRVGRPSDIGKIILFLADRNQSEFIIGQRIVADGGALLRNCLLSESAKKE